MQVHQSLMGQALSQWGRIAAVSEPGYNRSVELLLHCLGGRCLSGANGSCGERGLWLNPCSTVRLWTIQRVLRSAALVLPVGVTVVLLADRGKASGKLMKYLRETLTWHFRIRIKRSERIST